MTAQNIKQEAFDGRLYGKTIFSPHLSGLKRKASRIANRFCRPVDEMEVKTPWGAFRFVRINKITPCNTVERGVWS